MADRILTFQQSSLIQDIEAYLALSKRKGNEEILVETWISIIDVVEMDLDAFPEELHPTVFFKGRAVYVKKVPPRWARVYLHRLHKFLDLRTSRTLPG